jgi:hypothetical protein
VRDAKKKVGKALRFIASGGMADADPDVVADLLQQAHEMAALILADESASNELRSLAEAFVERLGADTYQE